MAQIVTFAILLFLMKRFAWKPFLKVLDDRRARIASEFKNIEDIKSEASKLKSDYESRLARIEEDAREKIRAAIEDGKLQAEDIRGLAREEGERILAKARESIKAEVARAEEALKDRIVNLTIDVAAKVIEERLTAEDDRAIAESFIRRLENR
ncbi:MAG: F0F1 ATP synthase subunit B [Candidatus Omnitrophota bacterium]|nr:F0F1 ATP synthase subunit B [Candidatus Omnitrophota bacterium]